mmetsp:Transcript_45360/g.108195  ORF Transcript_45360/g.108195 Transcript_45360/m.108195 type:complete len:489 (-) Transcript_45360:167-1633(-)
MEKLGARESITGWDTWFNVVGYGGSFRKVSTRGANDLMRLFTQRGECERAVEVFIEMREKEVAYDEFSFTTAIAACAKVGKMEHAERLLVQMKTPEEGGFEYLSAEALATVMSGYTKLGDNDAALEVYGRCKNEFIEPNKEMMTARVKALGNKRDLKGASRAMQDMRGTVAGEYPDAIAYNAFLHAAAKNEDGFKALDILEEMSHFGIPADVRACNSSLMALLGSDLVDEAEKLFKMMMANKTAGDGKLAPSIRTFTIVMQYYARKGEVQQGEEMFKNMMEHSIKPDPKVFMVMVDACRAAAMKCKDLESREQFVTRAEDIMQDALKFFGKLSKQDNTTLLTKVVSVAAVSFWDEKAYMLLGQFSTFGAAPTEMAFSNILSMHERVADGEGSVRLLSRMEEEGIEAPASFVVRAAVAFARGRDADRALALLMQASEEGIPIRDCKEWNYLVPNFGKVWGPPDEWDWEEGREVSAKTIADFERRLEQIS